MRLPTRIKYVVSRPSSMPRRFSYFLAERSSPGSREADEDHGASQQFRFLLFWWRRPSRHIRRTPVHRSKNLFGEDVLECLVENGFPFARTNPFAEYLSDLRRRSMTRTSSVATDGWIADRASQELPCFHDLQWRRQIHRRVQAALRLRVDHMPEELLTDEVPSTANGSSGSLLPEKAREAWKD